MINIIGIENLFPNLKISVNRERQKGIVIHYTFKITDGKNEIIHSVFAKHLVTIRSLKMLEDEIMEKCKLLTR
ncbi:hypothetical protein [Shimazuella kribbensis]|uniref:hypothetical protein n=1 Tax=Shimazuella kribbensis TaxID=139808 RepID=UPI00040EE6CE|nr:hypothetical protein [Shimazuella kribbensis]